MELIDKLMLTSLIFGIISVFIIRSGGIETRFNPSNFMITVSLLLCLDIVVAVVLGLYKIWFG